MTKRQKRRNANTKNNNPVKPNSTGKIDAIAKQEKMRKITDGWANFIAGLGGTMDKRKNTSFEIGTLLSDNELSDMYQDDGLSGNIVDIPADDMTKEWIRLEGDTDDNKVMKDLDHLGSEFHYNIAKKWARLYAGSVIMIGAMDGRKLNEPLNLKTLKSIDYLRPIDRSEIEISTSTFYEDPTKPNFGKVELYDLRLLTSAVNQEQTQVHSSRTVTFFGRKVPSRISSSDINTRYWGVSALQNINNELKDIGGIKGSVANLLYELVVGVFTLDNLADMIAQGNESKVITRMEVISMTKSIINAVLLGENESFDRNTASIAGIADVIDRYMIFLSASARIPVSKLFGRSPAGQNATGEFDLRNYYDRIRSDQRNELKIQIQYLVNLLSIIHGLKDPAQVKFNSLMQMTPLEQAEIENKEAETKKIQAETDKIYIEQDVLTSDEVAKIRFPDGMKE